MEEPRKRGVSLQKEGCGKEKGLSSAEDKPLVYIRKIIIPGAHYREMMCNYFDKF